MSGLCATVTGDGSIQRGKKGSERGCARQDPPQTLNEGGKDGWLLGEMGQMAGTGTC